MSESTSQAPSYEWPIVDQGHQLSRRAPLHAARACGVSAWCVPSGDAKGFGLLLYERICISKHKLKNKCYIMNEWTALSMNKNMIHLLHKLEVMLQSNDNNEMDAKSGVVFITRSMKRVEVSCNRSITFTMYNVSIQFSQNNTTYRINSFENRGETFNLEPPITGAIGKVEEEYKRRVQEGTIFNRVSEFKSISPQDANVARTLQDTSNQLTGHTRYRSKDSRDEFLLMLYRDYVKMNTYDNKEDMLSYHIYLGNPEDKTEDIIWVTYIKSRVPPEIVLKY